jgi:3-oxoacyl-[acyl-carrier protein] reductase
MDLGITGRVAMVAAASKGLGRATAEALAAEGCRISVCSRSVPDFGDMAVACDVSKAEDLQRWYDATIERIAGVDRHPVPRWVGN